MLWSVKIETSLGRAGAQPWLNYPEERAGRQFVGQWNERG
jgi:hypothetical protein